MLVNVSCTRVLTARAITRESLLQHVAATHVTARLVLAATGGTSNSTPLLPTLQLPPPLPTPPPQFICTTYWAGQFEAVRAEYLKEEENEGYIRSLSMSNRWSTQVTC